MSDSFACGSVIDLSPFPSESCHISVSPSHSSDPFSAASTEVLEVSADFLMIGSVDQAASNSISDGELLQQFRRVEKLPQDKKHLIKEFLDAFLHKNELQQKFTL